jgi:GT2 family glycosyltransferase
MSIDVSIVVPLFNEEESASALCAEVAAALARASFSWELVCVDDGSTDGTLALLNRLAAVDERMAVVSLRRNFGQTAALSGLKSPGRSSCRSMPISRTTPPTFRARGEAGRGVRRRERMAEEPARRCDQPQAALRDRES